LRDRLPRRRVRRISLRYGRPVTITFSDDPAWTASVFHKDYVDFFIAVLHELGHAIGLGHSDDEKAVMYDSPHQFLVPTSLKGLGVDDAVGASVLYSAVFRGDQSVRDTMRSIS
jgi:hypothetical protein